MRTPLRKEAPKPEAFFVKHRPFPLHKEEREQITYEEACETDKRFETAIKGHPLASSAGSFKDDPFWDSMMAAIENNRRELDAEYNTSE